MCRPDARFDPIEVNLGDEPDPMLRERLLAIPTALQWPPEDVALLRRQAAAALRRSSRAARGTPGRDASFARPCITGVAAGSLRVTEAGGLVGTLQGEGDQVFSGQVLAGAPKVFGQMVGLSAQVR